MVSDELGSVSKEHWKSWWNRELEQPLISLKILQTEGKDVLKELSTREQWLDIDCRLDIAEREVFNNTNYYGDAFPCFHVNLGPGVLASFIGATPVFGDGTVWFDRKPIIENWQNPPECTFDSNNKWWKTTYRMTKAAVRRGKRKYFVGLTDLGGNLDILASLRGTEKLLIDLIEHSQGIMTYQKKIEKVWMESFSKLNQLINQNMEGTSAWMQLWCHKSWYPLQCDFAAMISPAMFEKFTLPYLKSQCDFLDYSIYHLDGPGQLPHLDYLLDIPDLTGIEWRPGAGSPPIEDECWLSVYRKIQKAGKNIVIRNAGRGRSFTRQRALKLNKLLAELSPKGIVLLLHTDDEGVVDELMKVSSIY